VKRLSYADPSENSNIKILFILIIFIIIITSIYVGYRSYKIASANSYRLHNYVSDEIYYVDSARRYLEYIFNINVNESMYSGDTNPDYFNLEHPPLGKYLIAASIVICGDKPICWRLPGIIEASLIPLIIGLAFLLRYRNHIGALAALTAALAAAADPILYFAGSVAMLDIHLAFFETLFLFFFILEKKKSSSAASGLASSVKFSGVATVISIILYDLLARKGLKNKVKNFLSDVILPLIIYIIILIPLILYFGPVRLYEETISALKWHTTSRPPGPPTSSPLGWIINSNPFYYSYYPIAFAGILNSPLHVFALILIIPLTYISINKEEPGIGAGALLYLGVLITYLIVWLLGNHTFYSFYAVQLTPAMASMIGGSIVALWRMRVGN